QQMGAGATAAEYLLHGPDGFSLQQRAIVPLGLGLYGTEEPYLRSNVDDEWRAGDPLSRLDWRNLVFSFSPQRSSNKNSESEECKKHRAALLGNGWNRAALDDAWKRSQYGTSNVHEEGGLLGWITEDNQY